MNVTLSRNEKVEDFAKVITFFKETHPVASWTKFGLFQEDYVNSINEHWLRYMPPQKSSHYILAVLYIIIMTIGWSGNVFVIYIFSRCRSLRTSANILIMNLAVSDMLMMSKMPIFIINSFWLGPVLGEIACNIYGFVGGLSGTTSICTLAAISLNRYYVIKFPLHMQYTYLRAKISIIVCWLYSLIFSSIPLFGTSFGSYIPEGYLTSCSFDYISEKFQVKIFILLYFVAAWLLPFIVITFSYVNIWRAVLETRSVKNEESARNIKAEEKRRQDIKLAVTILLVIMLWFVAWTPYAVIALIGISNRADLIPPIASMIPALFCKTASCVDPFIYAITNPKFKREVKQQIFGKYSERVSSTRIWSTQTTIRKKLPRMHSCQSSEDVEVEQIAFRSHTMYSEGDKTTAEVATSHL